MKWLGYCQVQTIHVREPSDLGERIHRPHVIALAANIAALGDEAQNAPVIQDATGEIISGRDRFAAAILNGRDTIWVHVADATPEERADMEESENLFRRPVENRAELLARRVARVEAVMVASAAASGDTVPTSQTIKAKARKQVAAEAGVSLAAVKQSEKRVKAKDSEKGKAPTPPAPLPLSGETGAGVEQPIAPPATVEPPIDLLGESASLPWLAQMAVVVATVDAVDQALRKLQSDCKALPQPLQQRLRDALHTAGAAARALRPDLACPTCRDPDGGKGKRKDCLVCAGNGWLSKEARGGLHPSALLNSKEVAQKVTRSSVARPTPSSTKPAPRNTILLDTPDGEVPFDPTDDGAPF